MGLQPAMVDWIEPAKQTKSLSTNVIKGVSFCGMNILFVMQACRGMYDWPYPASVRLISLQLSGGSSGLLGLMVRSVWRALNLKAAEVVMLTIAIGCGG